MFPASDCVYSLVLINHSFSVFLVHKKIIFAKLLKRFKTLKNVIQHAGKHNILCYYLRKTLYVRISLVFSAAGERIDFMFILLFTQEIINDCIATRCCR